MMDLENLYSHRFTESEKAEKDAIWRVLCTHFFSQYVFPSDTVIDVGAGYCEFINNISAARKIALDLNPDVRRHADGNVEVIHESCLKMQSLSTGSANVVFMSNFLEHLPSKELVLSTLRESARVLAKGGRLIVLQPNIKYLPGAYWDFFDHHVPLTDKSLAEAIEMVGLRVKVLLPRFLPYTTKSKLPKAPWIVRLYIRMPVLWPIFGKQALVVAEKQDGNVPP